MGKARGGGRDQGPEIRVKLTSVGTEAGQKEKMIDAVRWLFEQRRQVRPSADKSEKIKGK